MNIMAEVHNVLHKIYTDPTSVAGFASVDKLYKVGRKVLPTLKISDVRTYLTAQRPHTEYGVRRKKFLKRAVFTSGPQIYMTADLADFQNLSKFNEGFKYVLFILDYFSRKLTIFTLKNKKASTVGGCFEKYLKRYPSYKYLHADEGKEFQGAGNVDILKKYGVTIYHVKNRVHKAAQVERSIRTIKTKLFKVLDHYNTKKYISHIGDVVKSYNMSPHGGLMGLTPNFAHTLKGLDVLPDLAHELYKHKFKNYSPQHMYKKNILGPAPSVVSHTSKNVGDYVRIQNLDQSFNKGYLPAHTREIFKIRKTYNGPPQHFRLSDLKGENIDGTFYGPELVKTVLPLSYQIEKVLDTKKDKKNKVYHLVKFKGWPSKFNEWLPARRVFKI